MPREYTEREQRNLETVRKLMAPPPGFDISTLFADDAVWWNGLPRLHAPGASCEHRGIEAIRTILGGSKTDRRHLGIDAYDLSTVRYENVIEMVDGDRVMRQQTMYAKTKMGRDYCNVYCFVFEFDAEGRISYLTEHWNTWWAERFLFDQLHPEPPRAGQG